MRLLSILFFFIVGISWAVGQNLIPNGSFEEYKKLPQNESSNDIADYVYDWIQPTSGSPDYYSSLASGKNKLPNFMLSISQDETKGYQQPHDGNAFVGFASNVKADLSGIGFEYLQCKLKSNLIINHKYQFICYTNLADLVPYYGMEFSIKLTNNQISCYKPNTGEDNFFTIFSPPITDYYSLNDTAIYDTLNWTKFSKEIKAKSTYEWLTFGCFDFAKIPSVRFRWDLPFSVPEYNIYAYYFIDDISLVEIPCLVGPDTVCVGEKVDLYSTFSGPFVWSTDRNQQNVVSTDSIYTITANQSHWYYLFTPYGADSLYLNVVDRPKPTTTKDTFFCQGQSVNLAIKDSASLPSTIIWNEKDTASAITIAQAGKQVFTINNGYCTDTFTFDVVEIPLPQKLSVDTLTYCALETTDTFITLNPSYTYTWLDGINTANQRIFTKSGNYGYTVQNNFGCQTTDSLQVLDECKPVVWIPNAFVINGVNKEFTPYLKYTNEATLEIYTRWGEKIVEITSANPSWDGKLNGITQQAGVYMYQLRVQSSVGTAYYSGVVHLME